MQVYKFGGASVKDANGIRNVASIIKKCNSNVIVVVSAMGKVTNSLEALVNLYWFGQPYTEELNSLYQYHINIIDALFDQSDKSQLSKFFQFWHKLTEALTEPVSLNFDYEYDRIVSFGELMSTSILSEYLNKIGIINNWVDIRPLLRTSADFREPKVDFELSQHLMNSKFDFQQTSCYITQGFLGSTNNNQTTTLGREGSDYTAAIIGNLLNVENVTIWKDVPGVFNADPNWISDPVLIPEMSYKEAIELTYYGANVIHPKTLKPLENKRIPLLVRSFVDDTLPGTIIHKIPRAIQYTPIYIRKKDLTLITLSMPDFSFIVEENLSSVFSIFSQFGAKVNIMENSALSFSVCLSVDKRKVDEMIATLARTFKITFNQNLELFTIRHYINTDLTQIVTNREILMEQKNRDTVWFVVR